MIQDHNESWDAQLLSKLRSAGMPLQILGNIFKLYHAEKKIDAVGPVVTHAPHVPELPCTPPPQAKKPKTPPMIMHLFKVPNTDMTPEQQFLHAIKVRNRTLGPVAGTQVSPYLDVEITPDNEMFLKPSADSVNLYHVLQQSTCRHDKRRRVAKRTLNALGGISGMCGIVNGDEQLKEIKKGLKFAESFEEIKWAERELKEKKATVKAQKKKLAEEQRAKRALEMKQKHKAAYNTALIKCGL